MRLLITPAQLAAISVGVFVLAVLSAVMWMLTGNYEWTVNFFRYPGAWFLVFTCVVQLYFSYAVWKSFDEGEPLELAWFLFTLAAGVRLLGTVISQLVRPLIEGSAFLDGIVVRDLGIVLSSSLMFVLLGVGLGVVLGVYWRLGLLGMFSKLDLLLIAASGVLCIHHAIEVAGWLPDVKRRFNIFAILNWASDPLLSLLLLEAVILWRAGRHLAGGYIASCYGSFAIAVIITSLGDLGIWAEAWGHLRWPYRTVVWYVWLPAAAWFAAAPVYMAQALQRAIQPLPAGPAASSRDGFRTLS